MFDLFFRVIFKIFCHASESWHPEIKMLDTTSRCTTRSLAGMTIIMFIIISFPTQAISKSQHFPRGTHEVSIPKMHGVNADTLKKIAPLVEKAIANGDYPGAVILAGHQGHIIYRGVFGNRRIVPGVAPMHFNTIFDIASLTKAVATTPAVMQLVEQGKLSLDAPVARYWPEFSENDKNKITIRELLTHTSGLPSGIPETSPWHGKHEALERIKQIKPKHSPGKKVVYSDVNFIILAYLVERVSGESFDHYVQKHIFKPLQMHNTFFLPSAKFHNRIAPTEVVNNKLLWGIVHDPTARAIGGVSGNAGLFSDAHDLGIYAQALLNEGQIVHVDKHGKQHIGHLLTPATIKEITTPQTSIAMGDIRGLGWDINDDKKSLPTDSITHTGWTGTSIFIDYKTQTWLIILASRTHPKSKKLNPLIQDRSEIVHIVVDSIEDSSAHEKS